MLLLICYGISLYMATSNRTIFDNLQLPKKDVDHISEHVLIQVLNIFLIHLAGHVATWLATDSCGPPLCNTIWFCTPNHSINPTQYGFIYTILSLYIFKIKLFYLIGPWELRQYRKFSNIRRTKFQNLNQRFEGTFKNVISQHMLLIKFMSISCENALRCMPRDTFDDKSALVQLMAWYHQATSHYMSQCRPRSMLPYELTHWGRDKMANIFQTTFTNAFF